MTTLAQSRRLPETRLGQATGTTPLAPATCPAQRPLATPTSKNRDPISKKQDLFLSLTLTQPEELLLQELRQRWEGRAQCWRDVSSKPWQHTQERMLPLLVLPLWELTEEFDTRRDTQGWSESTASQYWAALRAVAATVGIALPPEFRIKGKVLGFLAKEADLKRPTTAATTLEIQTAASTLPEPLAVATLVSFHLGQRIGDVLHLQSGRIKTVLDPSTGREFTTLLFRKGKTVRRRDPFTLHLPRQPNNPNAIAERLLALAEVAPQDLFGPSDHLSALSQIKRALQATNPCLCLLSIRRGGLQKMSLEGASIETLLHHSRHTTKALLDRYLEWGTFNLQAAREQTRTSTEDRGDAGKSTAPS